MYLHPIVLSDNMKNHLALKRIYSCSCIFLFVLFTFLALRVLSDLDLPVAISGF